MKNEGRRVHASALGDPRLCSKVTQDFWAMTFRRSGCFSWAIILLILALFTVRVKILWESMGAFTWYWPRCHFPHKLHWPVFVCRGAGSFYRGRVYRRRPRTRVRRKQAASVLIDLNKQQIFAFWLWISGNTLYLGSENREKDILRIQ